MSLVNRPPPEISNVQAAFTAGIVGSIVNVMYGLVRRGANEAQLGEELERRFGRTIRDLSRRTQEEVYTRLAEEYERILASNEYPNLRGSYEEAMTDPGMSFCNLQ
jgi:hypothetical protein